MKFAALILILTSSVAMAGGGSGTMMSLPVFDDAYETAAMRVYSEELQAPEWMSFDSAKKNFDGSWVIRNPRLSVDGEMLRIRFVDQSHHSTPKGFCSLLKMTDVHSKASTPVNGEVVVSISTEGQLTGIYDANAYQMNALGVVVCR